MKPEKIYSNKDKIITLFGVTVFVLGITLLFLKVWIIEYVTTSLIVLRPNSLIESVWRKAPGLHTDIYFFNWTNPEDIDNSMVKPNFEQVGPYVFSQDIEKVDVIWNNNNTVTYSQLRRFYFDEKSTNRNLSEEFSTANVVSLSLSNHVRNMNYLLKKIVSVYLASSAPYLNMTLTARQFFFDGIDDFFLDLGKYFPFISPELPRFDKFTFFSGINDYKLFEGTFNIENGAEGIFEIRNWNFNNVTPYFNASCANVRGSTGELYSMNLSKQSIGIFVAAFCRYVSLDFDEEVMVNGILGYKYSLGKGMLDNGTLIPGNECYCGGDCIPSGMVNISFCRFGVPLFVSLPNFYGADPIYLNAVEGLHPKKDDHEMYIVIEPRTGILLTGKIRIQLNVRIRSIEDISVYENVRDIFFPVVWMDQKADLPKNLHLLLKIYLMFPCLLTGISSILMALGLIFICIPLNPRCIWWFNKLHEKKSSISSIPEETPLRSCD